MAKEIKEGVCTLFRNDYKKEDRHPDYKNQLYVDGKLKDAALWVNKRDDGSVSFGLKISDGKPREAKQDAVKPEFSSRPLSEELDDTVPF